MSAPPGPFWKRWMLPAGLDARVRPARRARKRVDPEARDAARTPAVRVSRSREITTLLSVGLMVLAPLVFAYALVTERYPALADLETVSGRPLRSVLWQPGRRSTYPTEVVVSLEGGRTFALPRDVDVGGVVQAAAAAGHPLVARVGRAPLGAGSASAAYAWQVEDADGHVLVPYDAVVSYDRHLSWGWLLVFTPLSLGLGWVLVGWIRERFG